MDRDDFPQTDAELSDIARRRELPPDDDAGGDDPGPHNCDEVTRIVTVYQERRLVCCRCDRIIKIETLRHD